MIYPDESDMLERGDYEEAVNRHFGMGKILPYNEKNIRIILIPSLKMISWVKESIWNIKKKSRR